MEKLLVNSLFSINFNLSPSLSQATNLTEKDFNQPQNYAIGNAYAFSIIHIIDGFLAHQNPWRDIYPSLNCQNLKGQHSRITIFMRGAGDNAKKNDLLTLC